MNKGSDITRRARRRLADFASDEGGMITHLALVVMLIVILFSGLSLDSNNAWREKLALQVAADAAAHAAAMELPSTSNALEAALELAQANLTGGSIDAINEDTIEFGKWDEDAQTFTATLSTPNAVRVTASRANATANPLPTFLLRYAGLASWNIEVQSIAYRSTDECAVANITTNGEFSMTSNNDFYGDFCIAAAGGVSLENGNEFDDDNRIYVESFADIDWPGSVSMSTVVGRGTDDSSAGLTYANIFEERSGISAPYVSDIETLADNYLDPYYDGQPDYINTSAAVIQIAAKNVKYTSFIPGRIYEVVCGSGNGDKAQFYKESEVSEVVVVSECKIQLGKESSFEDVVLVSRDTGNKSVYAASKVRLGEDDDCAAGGGVTIYAGGDFTSASKLESYGATISAAGDVQVAAKNNGTAGITIYADGDVDFTAKAQFGTCSGEDDEEDDDNVAYLLVK